jgi:hypothetical protein
MRVFICCYINAALFLFTHFWEVITPPAGLKVINSKKFFLRSFWEKNMLKNLKLTLLQLSVRSEHNMSTISQLMLSKIEITTNLRNLS